MLAFHLVLGATGAGESHNGTARGVSQGWYMYGYTDLGSRSKLQQTWLVALPILQVQQGTGIFPPMLREVVTQGKATISAEHSKGQAAWDGARSLSHPSLMRKAGGEPEIAPGGSIRPAALQADPRSWRARHLADVHQTHGLHSVPRAPFHSAGAALQQGQVSDGIFFIPNLF